MESVKKAYNNDSTQKKKKKKKKKYDLKFFNYVKIHGMVNYFCDNFRAVFLKEILLLIIKMKQLFKNIERISLYKEIKYIFTKFLY